jgi:hypothetical protein
MNDITRRELKICDNSNELLLTALEINEKSVKGSFIEACVTILNNIIHMKNSSRLTSSILILL